MLAIILIMICFAGCGSQKNKGNMQGETESEEISVEELSVIEETEITTEGVDLWNPENYSTIGDIISIKKIGKTNENQTVQTYTLMYQSDECKVAAILSIPIKCMEEKGAYPCVIFNRGGNREYGKNTVADITGAAEALNMIVFASQYRGVSGGTGEDEFGGADVNDVRKLVDLCEELPIVDMEQLYMMGVSRGGMMTYMVCRDDTRIKRAVVISGVADAYLSYEERVDMREVFDELLGGTPEQLSEEFEKRSATYWAEELKCPFLIIHSRQDQIVSFTQSEKLTQKLEEAGKDYKFVVYEDDVHGLHIEDAAIMIDWLHE